MTHALQSKQTAFSSGLGALLMKFIVHPVLRRFGFRRVLVVNAVLSSAFIFAPDTFTAQTPYLWTVALLFLGGICWSLQFTSINAMSFPEVDDTRMSSASSFDAVLQQLSGSIGNTIAEFGLRAMQMILGGPEIDVSYFPVANDT